VPAIGAGLAFESIPLLSGGAWMLAAGIAIGAADNVFALLRGWGSTGR
jgi:hypothetical protein